jgi:hypothetical protein
MGRQQRAGYRQAAVAVSDRHPKWQRVEPGTVIPAGQPYRVEYPQDGHLAGEYVSSADRVAEGSESIFHTEGHEWFVDSSWRPPLELPTTPTWGMVITDGFPAPDVALFKVDDEGRLWDFTDGGYISRAIRDFIPLTAEQVARIEAAR